MSEHRSKVCFVTTGATAPFTALIQSILKSPCLDALCEAGFTELLIQYGTAKSVFEEAASSADALLRSASEKQMLLVKGFDFDHDGLDTQFKMVQESRGLVVSHAGSGTILAALRYQIPLVVVPNTALLDNHQVELAVAMERSNYLIKSDVESRDLASAIMKSVDFRSKMAQFPPITSGTHRETKSFAAIMDETMGFLD